MKFPLPANLFPPLSLSPEDERKLENAAEAVVKKTVQEYHELLTVHGGVIDDKRWKKIKQREDIRVYKERSGSGDDTASNVSGSSDSQSESEDSASEFKGVLSTLLTFGTIQGSLDDVMYGALNPTTADMQLKTAYCEDGYADWEVLARIFRPSESNPFRELSIKWAVKALVSRLVGAVMRVRDVLYIESVGFAKTPNGERIGYHMRHSVELPEIRELSSEFQVVRATISFTHIFRQKKENCVEVFIRGFIHPLGDATSGLAALMAAEVSVSDWRNVHCAEMKKLERMLRTSQQRQATRSAVDSSSVLSSSSSSAVDTTAVSASGSASGSTPAASSATSNPSECSICSQSLSSGLFSGTKEKKCRICRASVCSRCRVQKTMFLPTPQRKVLDAVAMAFCTRCVLGASSASSAEFAMLDALEAEGERVDYLEALNKKAP